MEKNSCSKFNGKLEGNICTVNQSSQEIKISLWNAFTKNKPEKHLGEKDIQTILSLAKMQPNSNLHFFSKEVKNNTEAYVAQAYTGQEYFGNVFIITKDGRIIGK